LDLRWNGDTPCPPKRELGFNKSLHDWPRKKHQPSGHQRCIMTQLGTLQFDKNPFDLVETNIYGIFELHGHMHWFIELFPPVEDNYIMFNALVFDNIYSPRQLSNTMYMTDDDSDDLGEHTVLVNGQDRFLKSVEMSFGMWQTTKQTIELTGKGFIEKWGNLPEIPYKFNSVLEFKGINIFETSQADAQKFVDTYLQDIKNHIKIKFENVTSGLQAVISGF
jgi:hypothetical protein